MKLKKKSGLMGAVIALSAASLVSVGFASWVISQGDAATITGTFSVEMVENKSHFITNISGESGVFDGTANPKTFVIPTTNNISFGAPAVGDRTAYANEWLQNTNGTAENLDVSFVVTVTNAYAAADSAVLSGKPDWLAEPSVLVTGSNAQSVTYQSIFDTLCATGANQYLLAPVVSYAHAHNATDPLSDDMTITVTFGWGSHFTPNGGSAGVNPYDYYNAQAFTPALAQDAETALSAIYGLNGAGYSMSLAISADE
jgi:hypothetical protein